MEPSTQLMSGDNEHDEALRFNYLTQHFSQLTFAAAPYNETFNICKDLLDDGSKKVASALKSVMLSRAANLDGTQVASNFHASDVPPNLSSNTLDQMSQFKLLDPNVSKTKGRRKGKEIVDGSSRMKSSLELATQKRKRKCKAEEDDDHEVSEEDDTEDDEYGDWGCAGMIKTSLYGDCLYVLFLLLHLVELMTLLSLYLVFTDVCTLFATTYPSSQDYELGLVALTLFYIYLQLINEKPQIIQEFWMTVGKQDNWMTVGKQDNWMTV
ncbi:hypothetical protein Dimus_035808 [Dionaea muscipula]